MTGASSGIGSAIALALARQCERVVLAGRDERRLAAVAAEVEVAGARPLPIAVDLTEDAGVRTLVERASADGAIDVLVHSAGVYRTGPFAQLPRAVAEELLAVNLVAPMRLTQAALPQLARGASIVFVSSVSGHVGFANEAAYAASKGAIDALVRALAVELAASDIAVNAVAPGFTATPMNAAFRSDRAGLAAAEAAVPVGRVGAPEEIAAAVAFLASTEARYVRGVSLPVDGGYPAAPIQLGGAGADALEETTVAPGEEASCA